MADSVQMTTARVRCLGAHGFHHMFYKTWTKAGATPEKLVLCVHGLTQNSACFDHLARILAETGRYKVVCPDIVGRGKSDWMEVKTDYTYPQYLADINALLAQLNATEVYWIGTSMGGIAGMLFSSVPGTPVTRFVLNDIGPFVSQASLERLKEYVGRNPSFDTLPELEQYLRTIYKPFGALSEETWAHFAREYHKVDTATNKYLLHYDPGISVPFVVTGDMNLWAIYDKISPPVLLIHGEQSDLLKSTVVEEMKTRGPRPEVVEVPDVGHSPNFFTQLEIDKVLEFLGRA